MIPKKEKKSNKISILRFFLSSDIETSRPVETSIEDDTDFSSISLETSSCSLINCACLSILSSSVSLFSLNSAAAEQKIRFY